MGPVRIGNQAHEHRQHDVYGQIVLSTVQAFFDERLYRPATIEDFPRSGAGGRPGFRTCTTNPTRASGSSAGREGVHTYSVGDVLGRLRPAG